MEASAPPGDGDWDIVNEAFRGSMIPLGAQGLVTVKVTWEAKSVTTNTGMASYFTGSATNAATAPDVDISAICFNAEGAALEAVFFNHPKSITSRSPGAIELVSGDQSSGQVGEEMRLRLRDLPEQCTAIALVVTSANAVPLSAVKGICMSATLTEQEGSGFTCDHLTWQEQDFPSSQNFSIENSSSGAAPTTGGGSTKAAPPQYGAGQSGSGATTGAGHSVSVPLTLTVATGRARPRPWELNVVSQNIPNAQTFVDALPKIRMAAKLPDGGSTHFKIPVTLEKGEELLLQGDQTQCPIHIGCGWDEDKAAAANVGAESCDADLSVLFLGSNSSVGGGTVAAGSDLEILETIYWGKLTGFDGAVLHSGDNQTGAGDGDDESVVLNLSHLPKEVQSIMFLVSNYNEGGLKTLKNVHFRVVRLLDEAEVVRYDGIGDGSGEYSGFIPCSLQRGGGSSSSGGAWRIVCHAAPIRGAKTAHDPEVKDVVAKLLTQSHGGSGPTVKPVNLRRSFKETTQSAPTGKTSAPLPGHDDEDDGMPHHPQKSKKPTPVSSDGVGSSNQQQQQQGGIPLPVKVMLFIVVAFFLKVATA